MEMGREVFLRDYWRYYLMLENKFIQTTNYVTLEKNNYNTCSNEYAALIQMIGAELDSFFKVYCPKDLSEYKKSAGMKLDSQPNICVYKAYIATTYPDIAKQMVEVKSADIQLCPFKAWKDLKDKKQPEWWRAFTSVKHSRVNCRKKANMKNTLNILGALYLLEMKYLKTITEGKEVPDVPDQPSALFTLPEWKNKYCNFDNMFLVGPDEPIEEIPI